jgi:hypothetical protein
MELRVRVRTEMFLMLPDARGQEWTNRAELRRCLLLAVDATRIELEFVATRTQLQGRVLLHYGAQALTESVDVYWSGSTSAGRGITTAFGARVAQASGIAQSHRMLRCLG